ncbi:hypothetical protein Q9L58_009999 [Maublancomyces gigas]|uniref:Uncharacterized protein n=1 Tax=Discina gigas TaxID=1032678 RepID=A0ABR3G5C5_9PEZI
MKHAAYAYDAWTHIRAYVLDGPEIEPDLGLSPRLGTTVFSGVNLRLAHLGVVYIGTHNLRPVSGCTGHEFPLGRILTEALFLLLLYSLDTFPTISIVSAVVSGVVSEVVSVADHAVASVAVTGVVLVTLSMVDPGAEVEVEED